VTRQATESLRGVVLAGGESSRFGANDDDKALARINSTTFLDRIVEVVSRATAHNPALVVRTDEQHTKYAEIVRDDVTFEYDATEYAGPLAGIVGAAANLDTQWMFCCGCDMPLISENAVQWLICQLVRRTTDGRETDAIAIEHPDGVAEPLHTIYRRKSVAEVRYRLSRSDSPQTLLSELPDVCTLSLADVPDGIPIKQSITNINTFEELESIRAKKQWS
jgi:molybdopterin-guanine dinucleotide biosynthesis protein A